MNKTAFSVEDDIRRMQDEVFQLRLQHVVLVEGKSDEPFWTYVLDQVIPQQFKIYAFVNFPSLGSSGKTTLTTHYLPHASRELVFCLDSDYDYLLENPNARRPFVFQTYVHSVENFLCYAPSLANILAIGARVEQPDFDFEQFYARYSEIVYPWLISQLHAHQSGQEAELQNPPVFREITNPDEDLNSLTLQIEERFVTDISFPEEAPDSKDFVKNLTDLGLATENAYLFIRGHDIFEQLTLKLLKRIAEPIIEAEYSKLSDVEKGKYYTHQKQHTFEQLLYQNRGFSDCLFFQKIIEDVRLAFS